MGRTLITFQLRPNRDSKLERRIKRAFGNVLGRYNAVQWTDRQAGLGKVLSEYLARIPAWK
jgi:hypothetical protein